MNSSPRLVQQMAALAGLGFRPALATEVEVEAVPVPGHRFRVTCTRPSMGTLVALTAIHPSRDLVQEAAGRAFEEMDRVVGLLNRYDPDSAVTYLNTEGLIRGPPPELDRVLGNALRFHRLTSGAFDPTVQPLVDLFGARQRVGGGRADIREPTEAQLLEALALVDASRVEMAPGEIHFSEPGMGLTLDGIAKGYVVDVLAGVLTDHGLEHFLLNAGGDIRSQGRREDGEPWRVGVQDPSKAGDLPDIIPLSGMAVATSGSYEIYFDPDRTHHHIVNAGNGSSPNRSQSVSVTAPSAMEADALATSVFVMAPEAGVAFIESLPRCACLIVDAEGRALSSTRWQSLTDSPLPKAGTQ